MEFIRQHALGALVQTSETGAWFMSHRKEGKPGFVTEHGIILQSLASVSERKGNAAYLRTCITPDRQTNWPTFIVERTGRIYIPTDDSSQPFYGYEGLRFSEIDDRRVIECLLAEGAILSAEII